MTQQYFNAAPPAAAQFPIRFGDIRAPGQPGWRTIDVDNRTALLLTVTADGQIVYLVSPYARRVCQNTTGAWQNVTISRNAATIQASDTLTVIANSEAIGSPFADSPPSGPVGGYLSVGQTAYNTGIGWWVEQGPPARMSLGDPAGNFLTWDGSTLTITGTVSILGGVLGGGLTVGAGGHLDVLGAGLAKLSIDATGLQQFDAAGIQRSQLLNDGSGWLGSSSVLSWTAAGVVTLNGSAVAPGTLPGSATTFGNLPIVTGLAISNNTPGAGQVSWNAFTVTYQGTTYSVAGGNTANRFIAWYKSSPTALVTGSTPPAQAADMFMVIFNEAGTGVSSLFQNIVYSDYISVGTLAAIQANIGAAHIDGVLDIAAAGGIYQGSGSFATPTTGLKVWNDTGIGRIAGYNGGVLQWGADTGGKLTAGAGVVILDASGIAITVTTAQSDPTSFNFTSGGVPVSQVQAWSNPTHSNEVYLSASSVANTPSISGLLAASPAAKDATVTMMANSGNPALPTTASLTLTANANAGTRDATLIAGLSVGGVLGAAYGQIRASTSVGGPLSNGTLVFAHDSTWSGGHSLGNNATYTPYGGANVFSGMFVVIEENSGNCGLFILGGNTIKLIGQTLTSFTITQGSAGKANVYWTASGITIENKLGVTVVFDAMFFRARAA